MKKKSCAVRTLDDEKGKGMIHVRPLVNPDGKITWVCLEECDCGKDRRGPVGGVCGRCAKAVPGVYSFWPIIVIKT
jgi:hypothetical protein